MGRGICSVDDCLNNAWARGWCHKHYKRWRKSLGTDVTLKRGPAFQHESCVVAGCSNQHEAKGYCTKHYQRWKKKGSTERPWDAHIGYSAVHAMLKRERGRAADRLCVSCYAQAYQWAYDHTDPDPLFNNDGMPYSLDITRYRPMCVPCHRRFDSGR